MKIFGYFDHTLRTFWNLCDENILRSFSCLRFFISSSGLFGIFLCSTLLNILFGIFGEILQNFQEFSWRPAFHEFHTLPVRFWIYRFRAHFEDTNGSIGAAERATIVSKQIGWLLKAYVSITVRSGCFN